jgi:heavy metal translocating P-type ATPase
MRPSDMSNVSARTTCDYCELPLPAPLWGTAPTVPQYCCFGCRVAHAIVQEKGTVGANRATMMRLGLAVFFTMNVMVFTFALWAYDLDKSLGSTELAGSFASLLRAICLLASLPVFVLLGGPLAQNAWRQLQNRAPSTDVLILLGVVAAYAYSAWSVWTNSGSLYVETGCVTLVFLTLGRWFEATGKARSIESLRELENLLPETVIRLGRTGEEIVRLAEVQPGDRLRVWAGQRIPADGVLCSPAASLDQQLVSGESWPVEAVAGDPLTGGTLNLINDLEMHVTAGSAEGTLGRLVAAIREARLKQGPCQRLVDRMSRWFLPGILAITLATLAWHWRSADFASGLLASLAVLLIACPCALGIATPLAIWVSLGTAARRGIAVGSGETLERLAAARAIRFDKTGTLTTGAPAVSAVIVAAETDGVELRRRAGFLARRSTHVFSQAIANECRADAGQTRPDASPLVTTISGRGVCAEFPEESFPTALGSPALMVDLRLETPPDLEARIRQASDAGLSIVVIGWDGYVRGVFVLREQLRTNVSKVITGCRDLALDVAVLTGDHSRRGAQLSAELAVPVRAEVGPREKMAEIEQAARQIGPVVMVGDGLNDAGACSAAAVGIALGCGADVTRDSAQVCLISNELAQIPWLIRQSRRTVSTVRANLLWSFGYNSVGIALAACGWLHPAIAGILMVGSSLFVIENSLRLASDSNRAPPRDDRVQDQTPAQVRHSNQFATRNEDEMDASDSQNAVCDPASVSCEVASWS